MGNKIRSVELVKMKLQIIAQITVVISVPLEEVSSGFDVDRIVTITGGNANGQLCRFPFTFEGKVYNDCTTDGRDDNWLWCAADDEYTYGDSPWGFCQEKREWVLHTIPVCDETHGCKRGSMCNYENGESGFCTPCDHFTTAEECEEASFSDVQGTKDCLDKCILRAAIDGPPTYGGNANGDSCHFPFEFEGTTYDSCTTDGRSDNFPWCATTANYTYGDSPFGFCDQVNCRENRDCGEGYMCNILKSDFINGFCEPCEPLFKKCGGREVVEIVNGTAAGQLCHFPFVFGRSVYNDCTMDGRGDGRYWCAANAWFDETNETTPWGFCS